MPNFSDDVYIARNLTVVGNPTFGDKITFAFGETIDNILNGLIKITGNLEVTGDLSLLEDVVMVNTGDITGVDDLNATEVWAAGKLVTASGNLFIDGSATPYAINVVDSTQNISINIGDTPIGPFIVIS